MNKDERRALRLVAEGKISVDASGRVWKHWDGRHTEPWLLRPREIRPQIEGGRSGYAVVSLYVGGQMLKIRVHRLVWLALHGNIPSRLETNHKNGDKRDNRLLNLEVISTRENARHAHRLGLTHPARGEQVATSKLTSERVRQMRQDYATGRFSTRRLASSYGISYHAAWAIVAGRTWRHLPT